MAFWWIGMAYLCGIAARRLGQAPLVGYLVAGLLLELIGFQADDGLETLSAIGIKLLLFIIGLKLDLKSIARPEVWGVTLLHMAATTGVVGGLALGLGAVDVPLFRELSFGSAVVLGFAASFSSTVFVVKLLEDRDDVTAFYGKVAVGVLIVQDIAAVIYLGASDGQIPTPWALLLGLLYFSRPVFHRFMTWSGHGEVFVLAGLALTLAGAALFDAVGIKGDLGALVFGMLAGGHAKSSEIGKSINDFKDVFLVTFFVKVGLTGVPTLTTMGAAAGLLLLVPLKALLFFFLFSAFKLRSRSSLMAAGSLLNFSEFGLIVGAVAVRQGWLSDDWMLALALAVGASFLLSSLANQRVYALYVRRRSWLARFESEERLPEEEEVPVCGARALVFGMGRVGVAAYDKLRERYGEDVVGVDVDDTKIEAHVAEGRRVVLGSATDADFWDRLQLDPEAVELVVLAMSSQLDNLTAIQQFRDTNCGAFIAATARFPDHVEGLRAAGADHAVHIFAEAGVGLAQDVLGKLPVEDTERAGDGT